MSLPKVDYRERATTPSIIILFFAAVIGLNASAQVHINPGVDTTDVAIRSAIKFYTGYMSEFNGKELPDFRKYWSAEECSRYTVPDPAVYGISGDYPTYSMAPVKTITCVKPLANGTIILKSVGGWIDTLNTFNVMYLSNHIIEKDKNQQLHFVQPITFDRQNWQTRDLRNIHYTFPKNHVFDERKANSLIVQIESLEKEWDLKPIEIAYFFAATDDEIQRLRGFDFSFGSGNRYTPSGISNPQDHTVYCSGNGESYFHEVVHVYLNNVHPQSPLKEGLATFYGGSAGQDLSWHVKRLKEYLKDHPEINLNKPEKFYFMDNYTNPASTMQGLLCSLIYKKEGIKGLKRLMAYTSMDEVYEKEFKLDLKELDKGLRKLIDSQ